MIRALAVVAALVAGGAVYLAIAAREPSELVDAPATGLARWSGAESNPAVFAEALAGERDAGVRNALIDRVAGRPDALALFRAAWDAGDNQTARERLLVEAARRGVLGAASWLADIAESGDTLATRAGAALGTITDRRVATELATLASSDRSVLVRANAARALGTAGTAEQLPMLARLVDDPAQPLRVRQEAALSIGRQHVPASAGGLASALATARLDDSASGEQLRISLIQALETLGTREARDALRAYANPSRTEAAFLGRALARR